MMQSRAALLSVRPALSILRWCSDPEGSVAVSIECEGSVAVSIECQGSMPIEYEGSVAVSGL